jgi:MarR family transcriptional regulator, transcriptional regulator for hemolysin
MSSTDTDPNVGVVISDIARLMRTEFDRRARKLGLTRPQWLLLSRLHRHPGAAQSELAVMLEVEKATAGRMIDRLEANGWVERRAEPGDRRIKRVYLTDVARREYERMWPVAEATVADALSDLSAQESRQLSDLLTRVKKTIVAMGDAAASGKVAAVRPARRARALNGRVTA